MTNRNKVVDDRIRAFLVNRTAQVHAGDLLDEIGQRTASVVQVPVSSQAPARFGVAMAVILIVVVAVGIGLLRPLGTFAPGASAIPSVRPSPTIAPTPSVQTIHPNASPGAPALGPGAWRPSTFAPAITFTVPGGVWTAAAEYPSELTLTTFFASPGTSGALRFAWLSSVYADPCQKGQAGSLRSWVDQTPAAFIAWLKSVSPVDPGPATPISIGGYAGLEVTFTAPPRTDLSCPGAPDHVLTLGPNGSSGLETAVSLPIDDNRVRVAAIAVKGATFLAITFTDDPVRFGVVAPAADAVIATVEFP